MGTALPGLLVLLGHPVSHSLSPAFQNAALTKAGLDLKYVAVDVPPAEFDASLSTLRAARAWGNATVPHKERLRAACDEVTPLAERVGAVNTFWLDDAGRLIGDNTDVGGFATAVESLLGGTPNDLSVGVFGAGGSAAAVLAAVEKWPGCRAHVFNRTPERARILCERFGAVAQPVDDVGVVAGAQLIVNATPIGLRDDGFPMDPTLIAPGSAVMDLVYRRGRTAWIRALRERGHAAEDGLPMLIEQGALAFQRWFGIAPDRAAMWEAVAAAR